MFKYPDDTYRTAPPTNVDYKGFRRNFFDLTREQQDELGYNEALPLKREPFTSEWSTKWIKGDDLIYHEVAVNSVVDEAARTEAEAKAIRARRDRLLVESDWTQLADCPLTTEQQTAWATYRQALRDVPQQTVFPFGVDWPVTP